MSGPKSLKMGSGPGLIGIPLFVIAILVIFANLIQL